MISQQINKEILGMIRVKEKTAVLIPALNEAKRIEEVLMKTKKYCNTILIIDDGSTDETAQIVKDFISKNEDIKIFLIVHEVNKGKGYSLKEGLHFLSHKTNATYLITLDADMQHDPSDIKRFLASFKIRREDVIIGSRVSESTEHDMPFMRYLSNFCTSRFIKFFFGIPVLDIQCGYRAFRSDAVKKILPLLKKGTKFDLETEFLIVAWVLRLSINQIPVKMIYGEFGKNSQINPFKDTIRWLFLMFKILFDPNTYHIRSKHFPE